MRYLIVGMLIAALLFAGCAQQAATGQQPPAGSEQQPAGNSPPAPPAENVQAPPAPPAAAGSEQTNSSSAQPPPAPGQQPAVKEFMIEATLWQFSPSTITVNKGDVVKLTLKNVEGVHGIYVPDYNVSLKADAGETKSVEFTADKAGTFPFRCNIMCGEGHREMTGTLVVNE